MLERLYQLREPVGAALASLKTDITPPTALEYEAVQDALDVLAPFRQATVELSGEKRVSASKVTFGICWIARWTTVEQAQVQQQMLL
ncbi:hypothetical protein DPEC_G00282300 [Dallia pectoralis]|uniref:Uncharacterized protein n=1 Tax=Dallia pectoralis TaxID=75939 RepID=A0ACC2FN25_DALPE|nr:hypothetical protein DPEC_G00282300 [Dallia pectoralis]